ncbi:unknown [Coraliomargarita sp. CAG:312]|nr:unknown [Coraliomargarita sp. CAG:312]
MFLAVSRSVSPLTEDETFEATLITSAPSLCAAISKAVRVLVLGSKNKLTTVFPRR